MPLLFFTTCTILGKTDYSHITIAPEKRKELTACIS